MLAEPLSVQRQSMEEAKRERAKEDFINLGIHASVNKLFKHYRDVVAPKYGRDAVPSLHKPDLDKWAREDRWYEALAERTNEVTQTQRRDYEAIRGLRFDDLHDLSASAIEAISDMLTSDKINPKDFKAKTDVAFEVLDRIGLTSKKAVTAEQAPSAPSLLPPDVSDENISDYMRKLRAKTA